MRRTIRTLLLAGAVMTTLSLSGQNVRSNSHEVDVALTYNGLYSNLVSSGNFWQQGGGIELSAEAYHGLGVAMGISGARVSNIQGSGVNLTTINDVFGPRYTWTTRRGKVALFGQGLIGEAHGSDSVFPSPQGAVRSFNSFALQVGGGVDLRLSRHFAIRPFQADWLRTQFPNASTNVQKTSGLALGLLFDFRDEGFLPDVTYRRVLQEGNSHNASELSTPLKKTKRPAARILDGIHGSLWITSLRRSAIACPSATYCRLSFYIPKRANGSIRYGQSIMFMSTAVAPCLGDTKRRRRLDAWCGSFGESLT